MFDARRRGLLPARRSAKRPPSRHHCRRLEPVIFRAQSVGARFAWCARRSACSRRRARSRGACRARARRRSPLAPAAAITRRGSAGRRTSPGPPSSADRARLARSRRRSKIQRVHWRSGRPEAAAASMRSRASARARRTSVDAERRLAEHPSSGRRSAPRRSHGVRVLGTPEMYVFCPSFVSR